MLESLKSRKRRFHDLSTELLDCFQWLNFCLQLLQALRILFDSV